MDRSAQGTVAGAFGALEGDDQFVPDPERGRAKAALVGRTGVQREIGRKRDEFGSTPRTGAWHAAALEAALIDQHPKCEGGCDDVDRPQPVGERETPEGFDVAASVIGEVDAFPRDLGAVRRTHAKRGFEIVDESVAGDAITLKTRRI